MVLIGNGCVLSYVCSHTRAILLGILSGCHHIPTYVLSCGRLGLRIGRYLDMVLIGNGCVLIIYVCG